MSKLILATIASIVLGVIGGVVFLAAGGDDLGPIVVPTLTADRATTSTGMTATPTGTGTMTATPTASTGTQAYTPTATPAITPTPAMITGMTYTPARTLTCTDIATPAPTLSSTPTATATATPTATRTPTPTPVILNIEDVSPGIVRVNVFWGLFCLNEDHTTGFIIDDSGHIGMPKRIAEKAGDLCGMSVTLYDGKTVSARKFWMHPYADVAVIQLQQARAIDSLPLGSSRALGIGDRVYTASYDLPVLSAGTLTGRGWCNGISDSLLFDAPGYSGGPLLDSAGRVVGLITGGYWRCAIPIEHVRY